MSLSNIIPIVLSGGSGTRLWPLSRSQMPKQFLAFGAGGTLIQQTVLRCRGEIFSPRPIFVAAEAHRFLIAKTAQELAVASDIVLEPLRRDSCAAIVAGAMQAMTRDPEALILVVAADHHIPDGKAFADAVAKAAPAAEAGWLVTFGIRPTSPAIGYGYIKPGDVTDFSGVVAIQRFVEKPNVDLAKQYVAQGFLWNSGNFLFKAKQFLAEAEQLIPGLTSAVKRSLENAERDKDFIRLEEKSFATAPQISVDFAVMEKTSKAAVLAVDYGWSDIGSWDAVANATACDAQGNAVVGDAEIVASKNVFIHSEGRLTTVLGLEDLIVVATSDAVLVSRRGVTEKVKDVVARLQTLGRSEV